MTFDGKAFGQEVVSAVKDYVRRQLEPLEARIAELEANGIKYCGTWQRSLPYRKGMVVTNGGSMWVALADTPEGVAPGSNAAFWQLAQKAEPREQAKGRQQ